MVLRAGRLLLIVPILAAPCLLVAVFEGEEREGLTLAAALGLAGGGAAWMRALRAPAVPSAHVVAFAWLLVAAVAALPFAGAGFGPLDALFEALSGATSTGLTVSVEAQLPRSLQLWRSVLQWAGGLGFAVLALAVQRPSGEALRMFVAEARSRQIGSVPGTARRFIAVYVALTVAGVLALWATSIPGWEALNHGIAALGTGGFTVTGDSFRSYGVATLAVTMALMIAGATSFPVWHTLLVERRWIGFRNVQTRWLLGMLLGGGLLLLVAAEGEPWGVVFTWTSALTTTGFSSIDPAGAPLLTLAILFAMFVGGSAGSTAGGLKIDRLRLIVRAVRRRFLARRGRDELAEDHAPALTKARTRRVAALNYLALLLATWFGGAAILLATLGSEVTLTDALFEAGSALGGVGLSAGVTSVDAPGATKLVLMALMWLGRLELVPVLLLFALRPRQ